MSRSLEDSNLILKHFTTPPFAAAKGGVVKWCLSTMALNKCYQRTQTQALHKVTIPSCVSESGIHCQGPSY